MAFKVLLADTDPIRARRLEQGLKGLAGEIVRVPPGMQISEAVEAAAPDVVIVDMARPDRDGLESIRQLSAAQPRPIVLFVDQDDPAFMEAAIAAGVSSYNVLGAALPDVKPILQAAVAMFRRHRRLEHELERAKAVIAERQLIERAKARLMREAAIGEPEAYRRLRRRAMDRGKRLADIAAELLAEGETAASC
jgi:response regulator NasT